MFLNRSTWPEPPGAPCVTDSRELMHVPGVVWDAKAGPHPRRSEVLSRSRISQAARHAYDTAS